ncbi:MAG: patatin-like phospholipase family protein [Hyphomicrobiaceae bacterium]|nr:patatin-like phospholipase family protein [Hyphomicrobiaceae bacterium]
MTGLKRGRKLNLALQGGGVHGAFTWGVLDALLSDGRLEIGWMSGTSAGAVNAVAVAHGLAKGSAELARETLAAVWSSVESAGVPDLLRLNPFWTTFAKAAPLPQFTSLFSPYEFNPLGFDPLRKVLEQHIDFEAIRAHRADDVLIAATEVATGRARIFRRKELTVEAVLASACLPTIHHAVEIDGRAYWDGGFSANPDLITLCADSPVRDTLLVQLNPIRRNGLPKTPRDIEDRMNTVTFNLPLLKELALIVEAQQLKRGWFAPRDDRMARLKAQRMHLIEAGRHTAGLGSETKALPDNGLLTYLHGAGRIEAKRWLERHGADVGKRSTVDIAERYFGSEPVALPPSAERDVISGETASGAQPTSATETSQLKATGSDGR